MIEKVTGYFLLVAILISVVCLISIAISLSKITVDEERLEAIESMNRVQQLQLNDLMYPGVYNGVH